MICKVLIIEDEPLVAKDLMNLVKQLNPDIGVLAVIDSVEHALEWFSMNPHPDLVFADVQLSDGVSFDIFKKVKTTMPVIFTTAYDEYAIRAFKVNGIDYLLKPIDLPDLEAAWNRFLHKNEQLSAMPDKLKELFRDVGLVGRKFKERVTAHSGRHILSIPVTEVCLFKREELIFLVNKEGKQHLCDYNSLEEIEELLDPALFFRANRQYIVNISAIESYHASYNGKVGLKLKKDIEAEITVSREKSTQFKNWFEG